MKTWLALALALGLAAGGAWACSRSDALTADDAAAALAGNPGFTTRERSLTGRKLVEVVGVRRIGRSSTEVEFTWRDSPLPPGQTAPLRTSMALFRKTDEGRWMLASLYKVD
jgi:hypothetical protein